MLKKIGIGALAAFIALGTFSVTEAATSCDDQNNLCRRGGYCYDQNYSDSRHHYNDNGYCGDGYCRGNDRGCW